MQVAVYLLYNAAIISLEEKVLTREVGGHQTPALGRGSGSARSREAQKIIIERVLKFGTPKEIVWLLRSYEEADIIKVIRSSRNLDRKTATFWSVHYDIPLDEIRCLQTPLIISCCY
jgi:hypothetical protein